MPDPSDTDTGSEIEILQEFDEKKKDLENADLSNPRPETEALWYMSESIQHRQI